MKKLFVVLVAIVLVASFASAQNLWGQGKMSAGGGVELALPMGTWGDVVGIGIGGFGLFQYGITPEILLTGQIGYTSWMEKEVATVKSSANALTILAGGKYNFGNNFYGMVQLGIYSLTQKVTYPAGYYYFGSGSFEASSSEFVFLPGVGYQMDNFDFSVKYTLKGNFDNICLNVAYVVPL
jgi:hypothetical protein